MKKLTPEQMGLDFEALLALLGKARAIDLIGKEQGSKSCCAVMANSGFASSLSAGRNPPESRTCPNHER